MTPEKIAQLRRLLAEATPTPWICEDPFLLSDDASPDANDRILASFEMGRKDSQNAALCTAAVNALPELLDTLEAAEAQQKTAQGIRPRLDHLEASSLLWRHKLSAAERERDQDRAEAAEHLADYTAYWVGQTEEAQIREKALAAEVERLRPIEAAMREWFDANAEHDRNKCVSPARWLNACRRMDTLMGGTWEASEPPLTEEEFKQGEQPDAQAE